MVLDLCERFGVLPSALLAEDAGLLRMMAVRRLGSPPEADAVPPGGEFGS